jgi:hypothetical protein
VIGVGTNFVGLDPVKALFWAAVINGVVSVPLNGGDHGDDAQGDGAVHAAMDTVRYGLDVRCGDDGSGGDHVCDVVESTFATWPVVRLESDHDSAHGTIALRRFPCRDNV